MIDRQRVLVVCELASSARRLRRRRRRIDTTEQEVAEQAAALLLTGIDIVQVAIADTGAGDGGGVVLVVRFEVLERAFDVHNEAHEVGDDHGQRQVVEDKAEREHHVLVAHGRVAVAGRVRSVRDAVDDDGGQPGGERQQPGERHDAERAVLARHGLGLRVGGGDDVEALDGHGEQGEKRGRAEHKVERHPGVAGRLAECPRRAVGRVEDHERHDDDADEEVGYGQIEYEVVARRGQETALAGDRDEHDAVAGRGQEEDGREEHDHQELIDAIDGDTCAPTCAAAAAAVDCTIHVAGAGVTF